MWAAALLPRTKQGKGQLYSVKAVRARTKHVIYYVADFDGIFTMHVLFYQKEFLLINVTFPTRWIISHTGYHYIFGIKTRTVVEKV